MLGFGSVFISKTTKVVVLTLRGTANQTIKVNILNGKLRGVKKEHRDLAQQVDHLSGRFPTPAHKGYVYNHLKGFIFLPIDNSSLGSNAWLSGFRDADGNFDCRQESRPGRSGIFHSCGLVQAQKDTKGCSKLPLMQSLALFMGCNLTFLPARNNGQAQYQVRISSFPGIKAFISYLNMYPQYSAKFRDFKDFERIKAIVSTKGHLTAEGGREKIIAFSKIRAGMNSTRTYFNWDHLDDL